MFACLFPSKDQKHPVSTFKLPDNTTTKAPDFSLQRHHNGIKLGNDRETEIPGFETFFLIANFPPRTESLILEE
jgi:hypothetical protein